MISNHIDKLKFLKIWKFISLKWVEWAIERLSNGLNNDNDVEFNFWMQHNSVLESS